jgi:hypothetical protein
MIEIRIVDFDDPLTIEFRAYNWIFQGELRCYFSHVNFEKIGKALSPFPNKIPDEYIWDDDNDLDHLSIKAYTFDRSGHCGLQIYINNKQHEPEELECRFSIVAEAWALHRLGELLKKFSTLKYSYLKWSPKSEEDDLLM